MVIIGFVMSLLMLVIVQIALYVPPHIYWASPDNPFGYADSDAYPNAFSSVFSVNGKIAFWLNASLYDSTTSRCSALSLLETTKGKHLWLRNNGSTMVSQFVDTAIVNSILFYWGFGWEFWQGVEVMLTIYFYKLMIILSILHSFIWAFTLQKNNYKNWENFHQTINYKNIHRRKIIIMMGTVYVQDLKITCIVGIYEKERELKQNLFFRY